jgi:hypothetical protein
MLRGLWQWVKDNIYDPIAEVFRTQEEIDERIDTKLGEWGLVTDDPTDLNGKDVHRSKQVFLSPDDVIAWIKEGGIPADYVTILKLYDWNESGDVGYAVYVEEKW